MTVSRFSCFHVCNQRWRDQSGWSNRSTSRIRQIWTIGQIRSPLRSFGCWPWTGKSLWWILPQIWCLPLFWILSSLNWTTSRISFLLLFKSWFHSILYSWMYSDINWNEIQKSERQLRFQYMQNLLGYHTITNSAIKYMNWWLNQISTMKQTMNLSLVLKGKPRYEQWFRRDYIDFLLAYNEKPVIVLIIPRA